MVSDSLKKRIQRLEAKVLRLDLAMNDIRFDVQWLDRRLEIQEGTRDAER